MKLIKSSLTEQIMFLGVARCHHTGQRQQDSSRRRRGSLRNQSPSSREARTNLQSGQRSHLASEILAVSGVKDPVMKSLRKIKTAGGRRKEGRYLAEGLDLCARAVRYGAEVEILICVEGLIHQERGRALLELMPEHTSIFTCSEGLLNKCLEAKPTPPCVALIRRVEQTWRPDQVVEGLPFWLGVDHGENADNLGMLLRSAEAAGVTGVLLSGGTVDPWGRRVVRAARGAMFGMPLALHESTIDAVDLAQKAGIAVVSTSAKATLSYHEVNYTQPTLILVGNEHHGVNEEVVRRSDHCVRIPMLGHIHSLNIAVAASLMLFEARRQRGFQVIHTSPKPSLS